MSLSNINLFIESGKNVISLLCQLTERRSVLNWIIREVAAVRELPCYLWNLGQGQFHCLNQESSILQRCELPMDALQYLIEQPTEGIFIIENLQSFLTVSQKDFPSQVQVERLVSQVINVLNTWEGESSKYLILFGSQEIVLPPVLASIIPEINNPLPQYAENVSMLEKFLPTLYPNADLTLIPQLALSAGGLTQEEIKSGLCLVKAKNNGVINSTLVQSLLDYKIERLKAFNLSFTPRPNVSNFGGLDRIRSAIYGVKQDYTNKARTRGIPLPKGWLLVGPPGTGKTFVSKFCASILEFPTIGVDTGAIASGGASYLRRLIDRIEASAPAVVYFDELDKLFPDSSQATDVQQRQVLGLLLTWLQDKISETFVIATLNRLDSLPPELTRLGRFDEIFYVGFPHAGERKEILHLHLARFDSRYRDGNSILSEKEWRIILNRTVNCTGAELSTMVEKATKKQFHANPDAEVQIGLRELLEARDEITPLYVRDTDRILRIENVAKYIATPSSSPDTSVFAPPVTTFWGKPLSNSGSAEQIT
jgi:ATP-dependent 26S proteasome regulatory subunit